LLRTRGGPFAVGGVNDLGAVRAVGSAPEMEDRLFDPSALRYLGRLSAADFWRTLLGAAAPDLATVFGTHLEPQGNGAAVEVGKGAASLGCILINRAVLEVDPWDKIRITFQSGNLHVELSVTDVRFVLDDFKTPNQPVIANAIQRFRSGVPAMLCVGLARAWRKPGDDLQRHWLQVNNIHFADDPLGGSL